MTPELLRLVTEFIMALGGAYSGLDVLGTARVNEDHTCQRMLESDQLSSNFKRKIREHQINSSVLRDVLSNYRDSIDQVYSEFKNELLNEGNGGKIGIQFDVPQGLHAEPPREWFQDGPIAPERPARAPNRVLNRGQVRFR